MYLQLKVTDIWEVGVSVHKKSGSFVTGIWKRWILYALIKLGGLNII